MKKTRFFLKAPWQFKREEVTLEQFIIAKKLSNRNLFDLFQSKIVICSFIAPDGTRGWVQHDMGEIKVHNPDPNTPILDM